MAQMARPEGDKRGSFTTIKVRENLRRWIKTEAAKKSVPMYVLVEQLLAKSQRGGRPWEEEARA